jgi:hypothetical protein
MATKEIHNLVLETLCEEVSGNYEALACKSFSMFKNNHGYLIPAYNEYYNNQTECQFEKAGKGLNDIAEIVAIPKTVKAFTAYWKSAAANTPDTYQPLDTE